MLHSVDKANPGVEIQDKRHRHSMCNGMFTLTDPIPILLPILMISPIGMYSSIMGIGHFFMNRNRAV